MSGHAKYSRYSVLVLCLCLLLFAACGASFTQAQNPTPAGSSSATRPAIPEIPRIQSLRYHYWDGWNPDHIYTVEQRGGAGLVVQSGWNDETGSPKWEYPFSETLHAEFLGLLDTYEIWSWNGFDESQEIMDAGAIHINIEFESGEKLVVNGYACFPDNFAPANQAVLRFFEQINTDTTHASILSLPTGTSA